ncbi:STAS domain-containing protein [Nocardia wallacei]|uniref:STAS domain-containing protein n=1 Tax=Nocardia wallacei TaxID=480035 RepID=UPI0024574893|nr:STAS domain-containing protein [Nocardia wallacei]
MSEGERESAPSLLRVRVRMAGAVAVVTVEGEVDSGTAGRMAAAVREGLERTKAGFCVVDLTGVEHFGAAGLKTLAATSREAENRREPLRVVVDANRPVIRPLELSGLEEVLALYHSVEDALTA